MGLRTISVGLDGSDGSVAAFSWAAELAASCGANLRLIHAWEHPTIRTYREPESAESPVELGREIIRTTVSQHSFAGHMESIVVRGASGPALVAESIGSDLIVVGRRPDGLVEFKAEFGEVIVGSTARYCAHHASVPVAAVPSGAAWSPSPSVVVGVDGSPASLEALRWATSALPASSEVHAIRAVPQGSEGVGVPNDYELLDPIADEHRNALSASVHAAVDGTFTERGGKVNCHVVLGDAVDGLIAPGFGVDLVVVGAHGDNGDPSKPASIAEPTLRSAQTPIVIVPEPRRPIADSAPAPSAGPQPTTQRTTQGDQS